MIWVQRVFNVGVEIQQGSKLWVVVRVFVGVLVVQEQLFSLMSALAGFAV